MIIRAAVVRAAAIWRQGDEDIAELLRAKAEHAVLDIGITVDDPKAYTKPWTAALRFNLVPDTELTEHVCAVHESPTL